MYLGDEQKPTMGVMQPGDQEKQLRQGGTTAMQVRAG